MALARNKNRMEPPAPAKPTPKVGQAEIPKAKNQNGNRSGMAVAKTGYGGSLLESINYNFYKNTLLGASPLPGGSPTHLQPYWFCSRLASLRLTQNRLRCQGEMRCQPSHAANP